MNTYQGVGTARSKRGKRRTPSRTKTKSRRRKPPPVTSEVLGIRCRVLEVMLLDATLVLADEVDGRQFIVPLSMLAGRNALAHIEKGEAVWLAVRREKARVRASLGTASFGDHDS